MTQTGLNTARSIKSKHHLNRTFPTNVKHMPQQAVHYGTIKRNSRRDEERNLLESVIKSFLTLGLQWTPVSATISKWRKLGKVVTLPRSSWPTKITPRVHRWFQNTDEQLRNCRPHSPQIRSVFIMSPLERDKTGIHGRTARQNK